MSLLGLLSSRLETCVACDSMMDLWIVYCSTYWIFIIFLVLVMMNSLDTIFFTNDMTISTLFQLFQCFDLSCACGHDHNNEQSRSVVLADELVALQAKKGHCFVL